MTGAAGKPNGWRGPSRPCALCGDLFIPRHPNGRYCSLACSRRRREQAKRSPRAKQVLYERDGWACYLCGDAVNRTTKFDPLMPSLDHVIPLSDTSGPGDVDSNLKTAHFICNSRKSVKTIEAFGVSRTRVVQMEKD